MATAGKILITPKGAWDAETNYKVLDLVNHNGTSWLAKGDVVGIEPGKDNGEQWFNILGGLPSNKLGKAAYASDLFSNYSEPTFVRWDSVTLNTPYTSGLTGCTKGFAIIYGDYNDHHTIASWTLGGGTINFFVHQVNRGEVVGWGRFNASEMNYDSVVTRTYSTLPYTCPNSGEVTVKLTASDAGNAYMVIKKNDYDVVACNASSPGSKSILTFHAAKGDVISYGEGANIGEGKISFVSYR